VSENVEGRDFMTLKMLSLFDRDARWSDLTLETSGDEDFEIRNLLQDSILIGGKNFRIVLGLKMASLLSVSHKDVLPYLKSAEMLHAATLVHDDVVDQSWQRRGRPSLNSRTSNRHAILAGDYLLAKCIRSLAQIDQGQALRDMTIALEEIVEGEWLQLEARESLYIDSRTLETIAKKKTGALFDWCCRAPAYASGRKDCLEILGDFGRTLGLCFQIVDDLLDFARNTGKPFLQDLREQHLNFVTEALIEDFPHLRSSWSWDPEAPAWNEEQIGLAIKRVRMRLDMNVTLLQNRLDQIEKLLGLNLSSEARRDILDLIEQLRGRTQ